MILHSAFASGVPAAMGTAVLLGILEPFAIPFLPVAQGAFIEKYDLREYDTTLSVARILTFTAVPIFLIGGMVTGLGVTSIMLTF